MHSEHISNLHPGWVVGGWLVAGAFPTPRPSPRSLI
jgi:hypothetical protein